MKSVLLATCLLISSCTLQDYRTETFGYVFHETTGIPNAVLRDGKEITIRFSSDSDSVALTTLTSLDWQVLYPNSDGKQIFVEGRLDDKIRWTSNEPGRATPEPFQEFKLVNWYIVTPFERLTIIDASLPQKVKKVLRQSLEPGDFDRKEVIGGVDLERFQRRQGS